MCRLAGFLFFLCLFDESGCKTPHSISICLGTQNAVFFVVCGRFQPRSEGRTVFTDSPLTHSIRFTPPGTTRDTQRQLYVFFVLSERVGSSGMGTRLHDLTSDVYNQSQTDE